VCAVLVLVVCLGTVITAAEAMAATTNADTTLRKIILRDEQGEKRSNGEVGRFAARLSGKRNAIGKSPR